jgi:hypothetical protein
MYVPNNNPTAVSDKDKDWLAQEIRERHIPVESNATPAEVIPWAKKAVARYKELGTIIPVNVDSYPAWKKTMDDWLQFLQRLEDLQNPAKNPSTPPPQQLPNLPASCQNLPKAATTLPKPATTLPEAASRLPKPADSLPKPANSFADNPESQILNPQSLEPSGDELEYADMVDGFATENERLAAAREQIHAHLADQPVRFARLSPKQQAAVFSLLETGFSNRAVAKLLIEPPPIGATIRVSKNAVGDWRKKYTSAIIAERNRQKAESQLQSAIKIVDNNPNADADFQQAAERILKLRILSSEDAPLDTLDQLIHSLTTLRKQSLAERKQLHAESK